MLQVVELCRSIVSMNVEPKRLPCYRKVENLAKKKNLAWEQNYSVFGKWWWRIPVFVFWKCRTSFQIPYAWYAETQGLGWLEKSDMMGCSLRNAALRPFESCGVKCGVDCVTFSNRGSPWNLTVGQSALGNFGGK